MRKFQLLSRPYFQVLLCLPLIERIKCFALRFINCMRHNIIRSTIFQTKNILQILLALKTLVFYKYFCLFLQFCPHFRAYFTKKKSAIVRALFLTIYIVINCFKSICEDIISCEIDNSKTLFCFCTQSQLLGNVMSICYLEVVTPEFYNFYFLSQSLGNFIFYKNLELLTLKLLSFFSHQVTNSKIKKIRF